MFRCNLKRRPLLLRRKQVASSKTTELCRANGIARCWHGHCEWIERHQSGFDLAAADGTMKYDVRLQA